MTTNSCITGLAGSMLGRGLAALIAILVGSPAHADVLLVTANRSGQLHRIDTAANSRTSADVGGHPHEVVRLHDAAAQKAVAVVSLYGPGIYNDNPRPDNGLVVVELPSMTVRHRRNVRDQRALHGLATVPQTAAAGRSGAPHSELLVTSDVGGVLLRVEPLAGSGHLVPKAVVDVAGPCHWVVVPAGSGLAFTSNKATRFLSVVDLAHDKRVGTIGLPRGAQHLAATPDGTTLLVADHSEPVLHVVDVAGRSVDTTIPLTAPPGWVSISPDGTRAVVSAFTIESDPDRPGTVDVIDIEKRENLKTIRVGRWPFGSAFSADSRTVYVANYKDETVSQVDVVDGRQTGTFDAPGGPESVLVVSSP